MSSHQVQVFLNHANEDKPLVRRLYQTLKAIAWLDPWMDEEKLLPGQDWKLEISKALEKSDAVIICLSKTSVVKIGVVQAEIRKAKELQERRPEGRIFIIPVLLEDCQIPESLKEYHWVNISEPGKLDLVIKSLGQLRMGETPDIKPITVLDEYSKDKLDRAELRKKMDAKYDLESLRVLCFDLDVRYENLPSRSISAKIVDLIEHCIQHDKYKQLVDVVVKAHS